MLAGGLCLIAAGCASVEAPPTPPEAAPIAAAPRTTGGRPANPERQRLIEAFGGEYRAPATQSYLNGVLAKLTPSGDSRPYRVTVLNSPIVNAFALPSGDIFVTRGLLALADDTSEIAAVMAHEIAHVTSRHAAQRAEFEKTAALFTRVNAKVLAHYQDEQEAEARSKLSIARFSRQQELEADQLGIHDIAKAGYDPYAASRFLTALGEWSALRASISGAGTADRPDMMATHPSTPERVAAAVAVARAFGPPGTGVRDRDAYLTAIDGIAFGDDSTQGVVRGTRFIHPKLGFAFEAPEGFTLENQSAALIGVGENGSEALRLDSIALPEFDARHHRDRFRLDRWCEDDRRRIRKDRRSRSRNGDGAGRTMELPPRGDSAERARLSADFRRSYADAGGRCPFPRVPRILPPHQRRGFGAGRAPVDPHRFGRRDRQFGDDGVADELPAARAR